VEIRHVCKGFVAYACPRCLNGTMTWEQDKAYTSPYLKCILCGNEKRFGKPREMPHKYDKLEAKTGKSDKKNREKTDIKTHSWQFSRS